MDPLLPRLVAAVLGILLVGAVSRRFRLPHVVGYLLAGVTLGPHGAEVFTDTVTLARLGEVGVLLLLFFVGMEVELSRLVTRWRVSVVGTLVQVLLSVGCVAAIGAALDWTLARVVLLGFAISLSSTALLLSMLRQRGELETEAGQDALGVLLVQDVAVVPMLIAIGLLAGGAPPLEQVALQVAGGLAFVGLLAWLVRGKPVRLPFSEALRRDHETQVFAGFILCFGLSMLSGLMGLSTAMGAFAAGLVVRAARETDWLQVSLEPFRVLFVATFFVSVGALVDVPFLVERWVAVLALILAALVTNTLINAGILRALGRPWRASLYVGALLSQIGEFSFVLAAVGRQAGIIAEPGYQLVIGLIAGSLVVTPAWMRLFAPPAGQRGRPARSLG